MLLRLHYSSLQVARSLVRKGISVFGIDCEPDRVGAYSRHIKTLVAPPGGEELKDFLISFAERRRSRFVLYPLSDYYVIFLEEFGDALAGPYAFPRSPAETTRVLLDKTRAAEALEHMGINQPKTFVVRKGSTSPPDPALFSFPCIIKPRYKHQWQDNAVVQTIVGHGQLVLTVDNAEQLAEGIRALSPISDCVIQEFIPGPSEQYYYYAGYRDRQGRIATSYIGQKLRTLPDCLGSETLLRSVHIPELLQRGDSILDRFDYRGPAGIDFKCDRRDGRFKVIEINCRIGINDCYLVKYGIDLPYIYYLDSLGREVAPAREYPATVTWYDPFRDFEWMRLYRKKAGVRWLSWLSRLSTYDTYAVFSWSDPWPFARSIIDLFMRGLRKLGRRRTPARGLPNP